jgi:hypothetical protein
LLKRLRLATGNTADIHKLFFDFFLSPQLCHYGSLSIM